jgi:hypothetical protein
LLSSIDDRRSGPHMPRIVHVHIPKTAGTALSQALQRAYGDHVRIYPKRYESQYQEVEFSNFDFFTGHIGFKVATQIGGDLITVIRDPIDRFLSTYFFMRQMYTLGHEVTHKTELAWRYDLDQFLQIRDEPQLELELHNRMLWQIAYSHRLELRQHLMQAGTSDDDLVRLAVANLGRFAIVGIHTDMTGLAEAMRKKYDVAFSIDRVNVTNSRLARTDIPSKTLERIEWWVHLDQALYSTWTGMHSSVDM